MSLKKRYDVGYVMDASVDDDSHPLGQGGVSLLLSFAASGSTTPQMHEQKARTMTSSNKPTPAVERLSAAEQTAERPRRRGSPSAGPVPSHSSSSSVSLTPRPTTSTAKLYERLVDEISDDELDLAHGVLEHIRSHGNLGRLQAQAVKDLTPADLIALRKALVHGRWAFPMNEDSNAERVPNNVGDETRIEGDPVKKPRSRGGSSREVP